MYLCLDIKKSHDKKFAALFEVFIILIFFKALIFEVEIQLLGIDYKIYKFKFF